MSIAQLLRILGARYRVVLLIFSVVVVTTAIVTKMSPKGYTASTTLIVDFAGMDPITGAVINAQQLLPTYMATQVDVITSHKVGLRVVDEWKLADDPDFRKEFREVAKSKGNFRDWLADELLSNLEVSPSRQSNMIQVSYTTGDPEFAAKMANAFTQAYIETNLDLRTEPARQNAAWFENQVRGLRDDLANSQARLSAVQREKGIVSIGEERLDVERSRLSDLGGQYVLAQSQTSEAISHQKHLAEARAQGKSLESLPEIIASPLVQKFKGDVAAAEARLADTAERVERGHPAYQRSLAEVSSLRARLKQEIDNVIDGINSQARIALQREVELKVAMAEEKAKVLQLANERDEVSVLIREVENAQRAYDTAMQRFSQTRLESEVSQTNISVLNPAVTPIKPSRPKVKMNIALAILFGGALAIGAALAAEMMDRRVRGIEDLELALDLPVLGVLAGPGRRLPERETMKSLPWISSADS